MAELRDLTGCVNHYRANGHQAQVSTRTSSAGTFAACVME